MIKNRLFFSVFSVECGYVYNSMSTQCENLKNISKQYRSTYNQIRLKGKC